MNISAAAEALGVSPETLRDPAGHRGFEDEHLELLQAIRGLREYGPSLESLRASTASSALDSLQACPHLATTMEQRRSSLPAAGESSRGPSWSSRVTAGQAGGWKSHATLEPSAAELMAAAPVDVHTDPRWRWLRATLLAASEAAQSRSQALADARREIARLQDAVEALDARVSGLEVDNSHLQEALEASEDRLQRTELIHAVRQIRPERPWWRFW